MLDPLRISYLTFSFHNAMGWDWGHENAVIEDPRDHSLIVSLRHQNAVIKFTRAGQLKWILGPHENWGPAFQPYLLTPVGEPFAWNYAQHAPEITPQGTLLLYDNGDYRASWSVGDADFLKQSGNVLVTFGNVSYVNGVHPNPVLTNAAMVRIKEVTHDPDPEVVFDLELFDSANTNQTYKGCFAYRSDRIPDFYSVVPQPVADLAVAFTNGRAHLQFSGNPLHTYLVEASTNLADWDTIGIVEPSNGPDYDFQDGQAEEFPARYYRVITQ
jgi:hypothetical protein